MAVPVRAAASRELEPQRADGLGVHLGRVAANEVALLLGGDPGHEDQQGGGDDRRHDRGA
jgi:hypothetical protein